MEAIYQDVTAATCAAACTEIRRRISDSATPTICPYLSSGE
jgi:hypothetical protein